MARLIDLSHPVKQHWRWLAMRSLLSDHKRGDNFSHSLYVLDVHGFTHVDAPGHFVPGERLMEDVPLEIYSGEAAVVDLSHIGAEEPVTVADLMDKGGHVREGDIVLLRTDWPRKVDFYSMEYMARGPYMTEEACHWLRERRIKAFGSDFPADYAMRFEVTDRQRKRKREENTTHELLLNHGIGLIEHLTNLHELSQPRVQFFALPLKLVGSDGSPVRAVALVED